MSKRVSLAFNVEQFRRSLEKAAGFSEFVIVVVCDVRGFSDFSTRHESPDTAMYIKRLYLQLITKYFSTAKFVKPTGDGLLLIFPYTEQTLKHVASRVISACFSCLEDFPAICELDPMINFETPKKIGFGITRGPACCLYSGKQILDYSGHLLNLASRLTDLARPSGILIDGRFKKEVIPSGVLTKFNEQQIYIRSLSEEVPSPVFFTKKDVQLSDSCLNPIRSATWRKQKFNITRKQLASMPGDYFTALSVTPLSKEKIAVSLIYPHRKLEGYTNSAEFNEFTYTYDGDRPRVRFDAKTLGNFAGLKKIKFNEPFVIEVRYVVR